MSEDDKRVSLAKIHDPDWDRIGSIDLNARAYGWEIGRGAEITEVLTSSPDNPFLDPDWRDKQTKKEGKS